MSRTAMGVVSISVILSAVLVVLVLVLLDIRRDQRKARAAGRTAHGLARGEDMGKHDQPDDDVPPSLARETVSVAELLEREGRQGRGVRLNWSEDDTDPHGLAAVPKDGDWPTEVLPRVEG